MKTRPAMTDDEIRSHMDFDQLLEIHKKTSVRNGFRNAKYYLIAGLVVGIGVVSWFLLSGDDNIESQPVAKTQSVNEPELKNGAVPLVDSIPNTESSKASSENALKQTIAAEKKQNNDVKRTPIIAKTEDEKSNSPKHENEKPAADLVYVQAVPVKGYPDLYKYFNRELKYPQEAMKDSIRGEVIAVFTINAKGLPENISIEHSLGSLFDKEVVRLLANMPAWKPATYNNKPVASKLSLPLTFQIKKATSQK